MTTSFWNSWQLWEKLCFVLACAIVFVVFLGCFKLAYNHWSLRRYSKIEAARAVIKQEMQHSQSVKRRRANQVPFGVRAIESGIEVDGVWISRSNTPSGSVSGSPALPATTFQQTAPQVDLSPGRASMGSQMTHLEISPPDHDYPEVNLDSAASSTPRTPFDHPVRKHEPPPTSDHQLRGRPTYKPRRASRLRYSNSFDPEDPETLSTLDKQSVLLPQNGKQREGSGSEVDEERPSTSRSGSSNNSGGGDFREGPELEASRKGLLYPGYQKPPQGLMPAQYEPSNLRVNGISQKPYMEERDQSELSSSGGMTTNVQDQYYDAVSGRTSNSSHETSNPFTTPYGTPKDERTITFPIDDDIADQHTRLMDDGEIDFEESHAQPLRPFDGNRRLRRSQVIRKVNSGFEILRPGTLHAPDQNADGIEMMGNEEKGNKRDWKKLHRRGRESSRSSYTLEQ